MFCRKCLYDLQRLDGPACPECGRAFDPRDASTYDAAPSWRIVCVAILFAGLLILVGVYWLFYMFGPELPGLLHGGDWLALLAAALIAYGAGWCANLRLAFLLYGGAVVFIALPAGIEQNDLAHKLAAGGTVLGEIARWALGAVIISLSPWAAGRLGWRSRNALRRLRVTEGGVALRRRWYRPRNIVVAGAAALLLAPGWVAVETLRVMYGTPNIAVDYERQLTRRRVEATGLDPDDAMERWLALEKVLVRLETQVAEIDADRMFTDFERRNEWDDGSTDFSYVYYGPALPPDVARERRALEVLRAAGTWDEMQRIARGPLALREVTVSDRYLTMNLMPSLARARFAAKALAASMRLASEDGDFMAVADAFDTVMAIAQGRSFQGTLIEDLVAMAIVSLATSELRHELQERVFDEASCDRLLATLERRFAPVELMLEWEQAHLLDTAQRIFTDSGDGDGYWSPRAAAQLFAGAGVQPPAGWSDILGSFQGRFLAPSRSVQMDRLGEIMRVYAIEAQLPLPERWRGSLTPDGIEEEIKQSDMFLLFGLAVVGRHIDHRTRTSQQIEATRIIVALELFAARNGREAGSLDELVPDCLPSLPGDPVTGQPFGYTLLDDDANGRSFLLYSVGADGRDDGGHYEPRLPDLGRDVRMPGYDVPLNLPRETLDD